MDYQREVIDPGDEVSRLGHQVCVDSYGNNPAVIVYPGGGDSFRGAVDFRWNDQVLQGMIAGRIRQTIQNDGAGGKPQFATLVSTPEVFSGLPWEVITMNADDVAAGGGFPVVMVSNIDVKGVTEKNFALCGALMDGYGVALRVSRLVNLTGETAIMRHSITAFCDTGSEEQLVLTWSGSCIGLTSTETHLGGDSIRAGLAIVGFVEDGYRCNGGTALTNILLKRWGPEIERIMADESAMQFVRDLCVPSRSYARTIARLIGWNDDGTFLLPTMPIYGVAHITGGGVWNKLADILPEGVGAYLNRMPNPPKVLLAEQQLSQEIGAPLSDYDCHGTFHGGCGTFLICEPGDATSICDQARADGHNTQIVGVTTESNESEIVIESRFADASTLSSLQKE